MRVILFGLGNYYGRFRKYFDDEDIVVLCDNNKEQHGKIIDGKLVIAPEEICKYEYDTIYILSSYVQEIQAQLLDLGINKDKIEVFFNISIGRNNVERIKGNRQTTKGKEILVIASDFNSTSGATTVLLEASKSLLKNGYDITVASPIDGAAKDSFLQVCCEVIIDPRLLVGTLADIEWVEKYDILIVNTVHYYYLFRKHDTSKQIIWWLHEPEMYYSSIDAKILDDIDYQNIRVFAVSNIARNPILKRSDKIKCDILLYGKRDCPSNFSRDNNREKMKFIVIGGITFIKGQDILVDAVKKIVGQTKDMFEIIFVGNNESNFADELRKVIIKYGLPIKFVNSMSNNKVLELLEEQDVLICCSREDSLPVVTIEAMMKSVPCIISNMTGTAEYVKNYDNSIIFENENADDLSKKIMWCLEHREQVIEMGQKARKVYEEFFSMEIFSKKIKQILGD